MVKDIQKRVFMKSPGPGIGGSSAVYYVSGDTNKLINYYSYIRLSDTTDRSYKRYSDDGGKTWSEEIETLNAFEYPGGMERHNWRGCYVDPMTGLCITLRNVALLPDDEVLGWMNYSKVFYSVSVDGNRSFAVDEQIIHEGDQFDEDNFMPGVQFGINSVMLGDTTMRPLTLSDGRILLPAQSSRIGDDGKYYNPRGGFTYTDAIVLIGTWNDDLTLSWTCSERIMLDPEKSTRGLVEPSIAELKNGVLMMVARGSNDTDYSILGHKWMAKSFDSGKTWTAVEAWTYDDGEAFYSPSSCSQLLKLSDGRLFWLGNICDKNPEGNLPRYPIVIGEVDLDTGTLIRNSVTAVDDRQAGESPFLTLSNFYAREDLDTGEIKLYLPRYFANDFRENGVADFTSDCYEYTIDI